MKEKAIGRRKKSPDEAVQDPCDRKKRHLRDKKSDVGQDGLPNEESVIGSRLAFGQALVPRTRADRFEATVFRDQQGRATKFHGEGNPMATARLRVFPRPEEDTVVEEKDSPAIAIRLADLYPVLARALRDNYSWLRDFEQDQVLVTSDLYEVVQAFSNYRPSA